MSDEAARLMARATGVRAARRHRRGDESRTQASRDSLEAIDTQLGGWCGTPFQGRTRDGRVALQFSRVIG